METQRRRLSTVRASGSLLSSCMRPSCRHPPFVLKVKVSSCGPSIWDQPPNNLTTTMKRLRQGSTRKLHRRGLGTSCLVVSKISQKVEFSRRGFLSWRRFAKLSRGPDLPTRPKPYDVKDGGSLLPSF